MSLPTQCPYKILGLSRGESNSANIVKKYTKLAHEYSEILHSTTDKNKDAIQKKINDLNLAYHILSTRQLRQAYNNAITMTENSSPAHAWEIIKDKITTTSSKETKRGSVESSKYNKDKKRRARHARSMTAKNLDHIYMESTQNSNAAIRIITNPEHCEQLKVQENNTFSVLLPTTEGQQLEQQQPQQALPFLSDKLPQTINSIPEGPTQLEHVSNQELQCQIQQLQQRVTQLEEDKKFFKDKASQLDTELIKIKTEQRVERENIMKIIQKFNHESAAQLQMINKIIEEKVNPVLNKQIHNNNNLQITQSSSHEPSLPDDNDLKKSNMETLPTFTSSNHSALSTTTSTNTTITTENKNSDNTNIENKKKYKCKYCGKILQTSRSLLRHINTHEKSTVFACKLCTYTSTREDNHTRHVQKMHNNNNKKRRTEPNKKTINNKTK